MLPVPSNNAAFTWSQDPSQDPRALYANSPNARIAATWYSNTSFQVSLPVMDAQHHKLSVYCVDWDSSNRNETLQLLDAATGTVLDSRNISNFHGGIWLSWTISGDVTLNVINNAVGVDNAASAACSSTAFPPREHRQR